MAFRPPGGPKRMKYAAEQRRKAEIIAFMKDNCYFEYGDACKKAKNGVYWAYDYQADRMRPVSIREMAEAYDELKSHDPELLEEGEKSFYQKNICKVLNTCYILDGKSQRRKEK